MVSNAQRALWTFLIYALVAPFFAALAVAVFVGIARVFSLPSLVPEKVPGIGEAALVVFVWSALPAVLTALVLAVVVWRTGSLSWIAAAAVAIIAFAGAAMLLPLELHDARPYLAFLAGLVSIAVRQVLIQADLVKG
ncbi:MAG: hypothetical protein ACK4TP_02490 [Hyphomicrobium sp.]|jgi:hypothetical protein